jgi:hypothetical protein
MGHKLLSLYDALIYGVRTVLDQIRLFFKAYLLLIALGIGIMLSIVCISLALTGKVLPSFFEKTVTTLESNGTVTKKIEFSYHPFTLYKKIQLLSVEGIFSLIIFFLVWLLFAWIFSGLLFLGFEVYKTGTGTVSTLYAHYEYIPSMALLCVMMMAIVCGGLLLFIIPGLYWFVRFSYAPYILVDTKCSAVEALRRSYRMTKDYFWELFAFAVIWFTIMSSAAGLFSTPIMIMATIHLYYQLKA